MTAPRILKALRRLRRSDDGIAALEFALILPALLLAFLGGIEIAVAIFIRATIESAVFEIARFGVTNNTPEGMTREERVLELITARTYGLINPQNIAVETLVYSSFADVGEPEPFEDLNGNGAYDTGEPYSDINGNGKWDADMGAAGLGGPGDIVVYRLSYSWGIMAPMMRQIMGADITSVSSVAVRNEPL